jgi:hypothetical protein
MKCHTVLNSARDGDDWSASYIYPWIKMPPLDRRLACLSDPVWTCWQGADSLHLPETESLLSHVSSLIYWTYPGWNYVFIYQEEYSTHLIIQASVCFITYVYKLLKYPVCFFSGICLLMTCSCTQMTFHMNVRTVEKGIVWEDSLQITS